MRLLLKSRKVKRAVYFVLAVILLATAFLWWPLKNSRVYALTAGPNDPSASGNDTSVGTVAWSNTGNIYAKDGSYATSPDATKAETTEYLTATGFNFSIPANSTVNGILVTFNRDFIYTITAPGTASDNSIKIIKGNAVSGTEHSAGASWTEGTITANSFGSSSDLWGLSWSPSDINSSGFGVALSANLHGSSSPCCSDAIAQVDDVEITVYYAASNSPPGTPALSAPSSGATSVSRTPQFQVSATDPDSDYVQYRIYLYQSDCSTPVGSSPFAQASSQTGWSGQNADSNLAYTSGTTGTYTYQGTLAYSTTYCWKVDAIDPGGSNTYGSASATQTFTTVADSPPAAPALSAPAGGATNVSILPQFQLKTTDAESDYLRYEILLYQSDCSTVVSDINQTSSQTGWSGQDQQSGTAYTGSPTLSLSTTATYTYQSPALSDTTTYCWKARAIDPGGSNTWSSYSSTATFTTEQATHVIIQGGTVIKGGGIIQ